MVGAKRPTDSNRRSSSTRLLVGLSRELAAAVAGESAERSNCYRQAIRVLLFSGHSRLAGAHYVEGVVVVTVGASLVGIEHGWVRLSTGQIVDSKLGWGESADGLTWRLRHGQPVRSRRR